MKKIFRGAVAVLALAVMMTLAGCGLTVEEVMEVVAPTEAPALTAEELGIGQGEVEELIEPLYLECGDIEGVFSPFWATAEGDLEVVEMTQLSLLAVEGRQSPSEISRAGNEDGSTTVTIRLRNDLVFSDGEPVTADDLIFTYYVLLDKDYDGPSVLYQLPIRGLSEYWNGMETNMYAKYVALYDEIYNGGKYDEDLQKALKEAEDAARAEGIEEEYIAIQGPVKTAQKALDEYDSEKAQLIRDTILRYWQQDAQALVDYCFANYSSSIQMKTGYTKEEVGASQGLQVMFAMVDTGYGTLDDATGVLTGSLSGSTWDLETAYPTAEDFYNELHAAYDGDAEQYWSIEGYGRQSILEAAQNEMVALWAAEDEDWQGPVDSISGIVRVDERTLSVTLEYCDEAVLRSLCNVYVAPLHIYGDVSLYDYEGNAFGFTEGDLRALRESKRTALGAGEFTYSETIGKTVYLTANENYWLGAPEVPGAELTSK